MLEYLSKGELWSRDVDCLIEVSSLMQSLGVSLKDTEIIEPSRQLYELRELVSVPMNETSLPVLSVSERDPETFDESYKDFNGKASNSIKFSCQNVKCEKVFKNRQALRQHSIVHSSARPFECKVCGLCFSTKGILSNHMGTHNPTKCQYCPKSFAQKSWLKSHIKYIHSNSK